MLGILIPILFPSLLIVYYLTQRIGRGLTNKEALQSIVDLYHKGQSIRDD